MNTKTLILFCESPFQPGKVDEDYEQEYDAAIAAGFGIILFDFNLLTRENKSQESIFKIKPALKLCQVIYRGWMLSYQQYNELYNELLAKNYQLINSPEEYKTAHYLPENLKYIENYTALTVYQSFNEEDALEKLIEKSKIFGNQSVIIKDYVKSEKHHWETACYIENASNEEQLIKSIQELIKLRGKFMNEGIVIRLFIPLQYIHSHELSGMPLSEEFRLFFLHSKLIQKLNYWENTVMELPDTSIFEKIAKQIPSKFLSMDIARKKDNQWMIIELGDAQVSDILSLNPNLFYQSLWHQL